MIPEETKLRQREPSEIISTKLRDETVRRKCLKFDTMCPLFGFYYPCTNLILKNYCPFQHVEDVRKAYLIQIQSINEGVCPRQEAMENCAIQNATSEEEVNYRKTLLKKYQAWPDDK